MKRIAYACLALASLLGASPAGAVTNENGQVLITQTAVNAGSITPGDVPGFPVTITVPGSYRLASNLTVTTAANGIEVRANEVTIDMGGFTLAGSGVGRNGIASFNRNLKVEHGTVRGFTNDGVRSIAQFLALNYMTITGNQRNGVFADYFFGANVDYVTVTNSNISINGNVGVVCASYCRVESSTVTRNNSNGIYIGGGGGLILGTAISGNLAYGIFMGDKNGVGNNTLIGNNSVPPISGPFVPMQPNACNPACPPPP